MHSKTTLRQGRPSDAPEIAWLIMQAMSEECCRYFHGDDHTADDFHRLMTALVERQDTQYSYINAICAVDGDDRVIGVSVSYDGAQLRRLRQPFIDAVREAFGRDFCSMPEETKAGELYLDSIAVAPDHRGKGIAKELLKATARKAEQCGCGPLALLVDDNNPNAERLYIKVGFRPDGTNSWGGHHMKHLVLG
ncbi:GNAT family N-acetyltransferase [Marseilla massiliensis]|uniref:GNAT family N-acetyltransferase n=1 Tax=Marseilla massiliensis TaxID=1841864 RepID=UPI0030C86220